MPKSTNESGCITASVPIPKSFPEQVETENCAEDPL